LGIAVIIISIIIIVIPGKKFAWVLFKLSSPYLAIVFLMLVAEFIFWQ
ncbi:MAG TPA: protoheme IX farnesyltransferase, partial [Actinobacteria bacterium]|nr:protoheme IX farnesyltransferase [Actinomycetota bacterium]